jgi:transposase
VCSRDKKNDIHGQSYFIFINAVFCLLRTGAPWRDLPPDYDGCSNTHRRFIRWRDKGMWEKLLEELVDAPDYAWLMIDASHIKVHPHASGAKGGNQEMSRFWQQCKLDASLYGLISRDYNI